MNKLKKFIKAFLRYILYFVPVDLILNISLKLFMFIAKISYFKSWNLEANGRPQFFKHRINLAQWINGYSSWSFASRGTYARQQISKGSVVLDLCSGDGFYSYYFYRDVAKKIDAIDNDIDAINYSIKYHSAENIKYSKIDIVNEDFPSNTYDYVIWNAGICYFDEFQLDSLLIKIGKLNKNIVLIGQLPKANSHPDHKMEFLSADAFSNFISKYFNKINVIEVSNDGVIDFMFTASCPKH